MVLKFGGTSVADVPQIKKIALKVKKEVNQGYKVIVVVSAMAGVTNNLIDLAANSNISLERNLKSEETLFANENQML